MHSLSHLLQVCYICILIRLLNGYLLFAANLDDFHSIAKKLVSDNLADSLTRMASKPTVRERQDSDYEDSDEEEEPRVNKYKKHPPSKDKAERKPKETFNLNQDTKVDFEELVERVKKRLTMELKQKYLDSIRLENRKKHIKTYDRINDKTTSSNYKNEYNKKQNIKESTKQYNVEEMSPFVDEPVYKEEIFSKPKVKQKLKIPNDERYEYADALETTSLTDLKPDKTNDNKDVDVQLNVNESEEITSTTNSNDLYKKVDMTKKDSYEDYVMPAKDNIYASSETKPQPYALNNKRYKIESNSPANHKNFENSIITAKTIQRFTTEYERDGSNTEKESSMKKTNNYDYREKLIESEEIKAKTENLWFDNNEKNNNTLILTERSKSKYGTRLPTRHTYNMVTPNYYANLPVIVEKYNFNEPIPEKDRERESLQYIGNPPASINKKVRLL